MTEQSGWFLVGAGLCLCLPACTRHGVQGPHLAAPPMIGQFTPTASPSPPTPAIASQPAPPPAPAPEAVVAQTGHKEPPPPEPQPPPPPEPPPRLPPPEPPAQPAPLTPRPPEEPPLVAALRCFLDRRPDDALKFLQRYDKVNQELFLCLLPLLARLAEDNLDREDPQEVAQVVEQLENLLLPLRPRAALTINQICFCRRIEKFGTYEPLPRDHVFRPGERVQVYVELRNFSSQFVDPFYVTRLKSSLEIHDYNGAMVWRQDCPEDRTRADQSRTPRQDYFHNYQITLPQIPQGPYTLWVKVVDVGRIPHRETKRSLDFRVTTMPPRQAEP